MPNPRYKTSSNPYLKSLCNNYYKQGPSNADPPPAKPTQATPQGPNHRKATAGSYELRPALFYPYNSTESSKQTQERLEANVRKLYPNRASQQEESKATTLTSIGTVYRRQSKKIRTGNRSIDNLRYHNISLYAKTDLY
ncbi:cucumisin-like [Dorcoceras hygrometricum]|uniref:Cucumisin-like n=1 Tax=Dorcoceras hygrometricum TaxID=472368 RepID=A0A2Z7AZ34_9LAMI|nr:cucumisin-like [Dorcoceras hygrometricum]